MKNLVSLLFVSLLTIPSSVWATTSTKPPLLVHEGSKESWLATMRTKLPEMLCEPKHYFTQCFDVTPDECIAASSLYVQACLNNVTLSLPPEFDKAQGQYWGMMVGRCSYDLYEKFMVAKKRSDPHCTATPSSP